MNVTGVAPSPNATIRVTWSAMVVPRGEHYPSRKFHRFHTKPTFQTTIPTDGMVTVKILRDINGDGVVNIYWMIILANHFGQRV